MEKTKKIDWSNVTFGERLAYARRQKGLTQKQLAESVGMQRHRLSNWEVGRHSPDVSMIQKITRTLEISEAWLMGNDNNFSMKNATENLQSIQLTKAQQKLVTDNEKVINIVLHQHVPYQLTRNDIYGDAAINLCRVAKIYDESNNRTKGFTKFAFYSVERVVLNSLRREWAYCKHVTSLNEPIHSHSHKSDGSTKEFGLLIPSPNDDMESLEYRILIESVCQKVEPVLSTKEYAAFTLWLHGKNNEEIAGALKISIPAAKDRIQKAKIKCRTSFDAADFFS